MGSLLISVRGVTTLLWVNPLSSSRASPATWNSTRLAQATVASRSNPCPFSIEKLVYLKISMALRHQIDLYEFPYD